MFRTMFSPIIRSTWLYLQHLVMFTNVAAGWCHGWAGTVYMFRATVSPIIRSTWLYLHHLVIFTNVAAGWCHGWAGTVYMFRAMFSPIIRSTCLYLQHLVLFNSVAVGWCHTSRCFGTAFQSIYDTSRQRHWWILPDDVNTVKCSWWWAKTSSETCEAD